MLIGLFFRLWRMFASCVFELREPASHKAANDGR